jgi:hypothetical protein
MDSDARWRPAHTSVETIDYLNAFVKVLPNWPSGSPGTNPIENVWAIMKHGASEVNVQTVPELIEVILQVWIDLPVPEMRNLANSMQRRFEGVVAAHGGPNGY